MPDSGEWSTKRTQFFQDSETRNQKREANMGIFLMLCAVAGIAGSAAYIVWAIESGTQ